MNVMADQNHDNKGAQDEGGGGGTTSFFFFLLIFPHVN